MKIVKPFKSTDIWTKEERERVRDFIVHGFLFRYDSSKQKAFSLKDNRYYPVDLETDKNDGRRPSLFDGQFYIGDLKRDGDEIVLTNKEYLDDTTLIAILEDIKDDGVYVDYIEFLGHEFHVLSEVDGYNNELVVAFVYDKFTLGVQFSKFIPENFVDGYIDAYIKANYVQVKDNVWRHRNLVSDKEDATYDDLKESLSDWLAGVSK